jgi:hypothetical protein
MDGDAARELWASAAGHHGVFTRRHALAVGLTRHEVDHQLWSGAWKALHDGVYAAAATPPTWRGHLLAACWAGGVRAAASHRSALALYDLPGGRMHVAEITTPRWQRARHSDVLAHETRELPETDVISVDRIPVTTPARALIDAASVLHTSTLELVVDEALRRDLVEFGVLWGRLVELSKPGRRGVGVLRKLLVQRHPDAHLSESVREHLLMKALRAGGLPTPVAQYAIKDPSGRLVARPDVAYPGSRVAVEYDSYLHHGGRAKYVHDLARRNRLTALGWRVVHCTAADLRSGGADLCASLRTMLTGAA